MLYVVGVHYGGRHTLTLWSHGTCRRGLALCGSAGRSGRGGAGIGKREVVRALLEADDAVDDVLGVRVHGRRHDPREMVREEVGRVEARVARSIPPALPVFGTPGKRTRRHRRAPPPPRRPMRNATELPPSAEPTRALPCGRVALQ